MPCPSWKATVKIKCSYSYENISFIVHYTGAFKDKLVEFARNFAVHYMECEVKCSTFPDLMKHNLVRYLQRRGENNKDKNLGLKKTWNLLSNLR